MVRNLRSIGLLVGAVLALGGLLASSAGAHTPATFTFEQSETTVTGEKHPETSAPVLTITGREVTCTIEEFHGEVVGSPFQLIALIPIYTECTVFGFANGKITGLGHYPAVEGAGGYCYYVITAAGKLNLECPAGKDVTIEAGGTCTVHIPAQKDLGSIGFAGGVREGRADLTMTVNLTNITVTHTDESFLCPFSGSGEVGTATLVGKWTFWGKHSKTEALAGIAWDATVA